MKTLRVTLLSVGAALTAIACHVASPGPPIAANAGSGPTDAPVGDNHKNVAIPSERSDPRAAEVDKLFSRWDKAGSPGCAIAVLWNGKVIHARGYGRANLDYELALTPTSVFQVASVSKQFTAFAIWLLAGQGKLSLDDDVRKYLPELPDYGSRITVRHLLYHTSGVRDYFDLLALAGWRDEDVVTEADILDMATRQKELNFKPGSERGYTNTGYVLLAVLVKRVTGQTLRRFAEEHIFKPLGMEHTHFVDDHAMTVKDRASPYAPGGDDGFKLSPPVHDAVGPTGLYSTVLDLARWEQNFHDLRVGGEALRGMLLPGKLESGEALAFGSGLVLGEHRGQKTVWQNGAHGGYKSMLLRLPDQHFSVACLCNAFDARPNTLAYQVAAIYLADKLTPEPAVATVEASPGDMAAKAGIYFNATLDDLWTLEQKDGKLFTYGLPLQPIAKDHFLVGTFRELLFKPSRSGGSPDLYSVWPGETPVAYERARAVSPTRAELDACVGTYRSDEIGALVTLTVKDGALVLLRPKASESPLRPLMADGFVNEDLGVVHMVRGKRDRRIVGLTLTTGGVRRLRFAR